MMMMMSMVPWVVKRTATKNVGVRKTLSNRKVRTHGVDALEPEFTVEFSASSCDI